MSAREDDDSFVNHLSFYHMIDAVLMLSGSRHIYTHIMCLRRRKSPIKPE